MLTDEEIMDIRNRAKLNDNRQIDPMAFARDIERAVLAKATAAVDGKENNFGEPDVIYLQMHDPDAGEEKSFISIHKGDITWCRDKINENDVRYIREDLASAMPIPKQEPVGRISAVFNQGAGHFFNCEWLDHCNFKEGDLLYAEPQPAQAAAIPEQWRQIVTDLADELECEIKAKYSPEILIYPSQKRSFDADMDSIIRARAMLSASQKPE